MPVNIFRGWSKLKSTISNSNKYILLIIIPIPVKAIEIIDNLPIMLSGNLYDFLSEFTFFVISNFGKLKFNS